MPPVSRRARTVRRSAPARPRDPEATRGAILDAAEHLLLQRGVAETSLAQVARRARVTKSLIHHYFGSKDALWIEVKQRRFRAYVEDQMADLDPVPTSAQAALQAAIERYFLFLARHPDIVRLFARMWLEGDAALDELDRQVTSAGAEAIRAAQQDGQLDPDIDPVLMIAVFISASHGWFSFRHAPFSAAGRGRNVSPAGAVSAADKAFLRTLIRVFFRGVLPAHAVPNRPT